MPNPLDAEMFSQPMDPANLLDWQCPISQGNDDANWLRPGEGVASFTLTATAEAAAAGLQIETTAGRAPTITNNVLRFWLSVATSQWGADLFNGDGVILAVECTIVTDSVPFRRRQGSKLVQVANQ